MPLKKYQIAAPHIRVGLWEIAEEESFFLQKLSLSEAEHTEMSQYLSQRRVSWLAARYLLKKMLGNDAKIEKDADGKPFVVGANARWHISLSHSGKWVAAIVAPCPVGIDIERVSERIERVAPRVMNAEKFKNLQSDTRHAHLHVYWGAKEALYKAYGRRELDFRAHIRIKPFDFDRNNGYTEGGVEKENVLMNFAVFYEEIENFILVYCWQIPL